jgi:hypothetical protein
LRRGLGAAQVAAPRRVVQVQLQDAGLAQRLFHLDRVEQLAQLALGRAVAAGDQQLGQLLRERAAAAADLPGLLVVVDRREYFGQVVAGVGEESAGLRPR